MMKTQRAGFTLVELLIVSVLGAITLGAVYQTLMVQEESYRAGGAMIGDQEAMRTALGILEAELREVASVDGGVAGGSDLNALDPRQITFRAQRKIGFICGISKSEKWVIAATLGDYFAAGDSLLLFVEGDPLKYKDDTWQKARVSGTSSSSDATCASKWGSGTPLQKVQLEADLTAVELGSPMRGFQWITYGLYDFGARGWGLGRHAPGEAPTFLVGQLASPELDGLRFSYFEAEADPADTPDEVAWVEIQVRSAADPVNDVQSVALNTNLFLRNN